MTHNQQMGISLF